MKHFRLIAILSIVLFSSCAKQNEDEFIASKEVKYLVTNADENGTKTSVDEEGLIYWNPNEEINVFYGSTSVKFKSLNSEKATSAVFGGIQPLIGSNENTPSMLVMGLYPYDNEATCHNGTITTTFSDTQKAVENSFADKSFPTIAKTTLGKVVK